MTAFYNEIDPYAAQWLRNIIDAGHIAPGVVDTRSIEDIAPHELDPYTQCHFFAGIGVWSLALRRAGWPDDRPVWTGSCPCQPFSAAGQGRGLDDERHLWPGWLHLVRQCRPAVLIGEQVASRDAEPWLDLVQDDLEGLGYAFGAIPFPAAGVGAPHIRDRLYWVADSKLDVGGREISTPNHGGSQGDRSANWIGRRGGASIAVANGGGAGLEVGGKQSARTEQPAAERGGALGGLGHADEGRGRRDAGAVPGAQSGAGRGVRGLADGVEPAGAAGELVDTAGSGRGQGGRDVAGGAAACGERSAAEQRNAGATRGFWADAEWIACRDGKSRPVEPGTFPLAHGVAGRVGRLRAYGNAIVAPQAQLWVEIVMQELAA